ncbi:MAG: hypothetical protein FP820_07500 [Sulfurimonas sp.]|nr:hypothetical protein [Sulfurimonas sp.]MBU1217700.1 hypothetical protein [bacterium]MBU1434272.1 hypothetical protein [bacterium]MBU1503663.1 hypothetical protein [bacterium]MBU3939481.1 hypothetical protein [bacterium]
MAQVSEDMGCLNDICVARDKCKRQEIAKNETVREIQKFGGSEAKNSGRNKAIFLEYIEQK